VKKPKKKTKTIKKASKVNSLAVAREAFAKVDLKPKQAKTKSKPEEIMDRSTLVGLARMLKGAGSDVKALKSDTDEQLQKKVNEAIQQLPSDEIVKKLEAVDPNKLVAVLKRDCLGIFVDFSDVSCIRCPDASQCVAKFIENLKGGMAELKGAMPDAKAETKLDTKTESAKISPVTRYEAKRLVFVRDVKNPNPKGDDYYDTIESVLDKQPETLGELRAIVEKDFDFDGDGDFMKFVTALRDKKEGVIKLDVDLSEDNKVELRKAGYVI
jgi:hypothetical protein